MRERNSAPRGSAQLWLWLGEGLRQWLRQVHLLAHSRAAAGARPRPVVAARLAAVGGAGPLLRVAQDLGALVQVRALLRVVLGLVGGRLLHPLLLRQLPLRVALLLLLQALPALLPSGLGLLDLALQTSLAVNERLLELPLLQRQHLLQPRERAGGLRDAVLAVLLLGQRGL